MSTRDEIRAERDAEIIAWLGKKAREHRSTGSRKSALQADVIELMASKLARGAVRANNTAGIVTRAGALHEAADMVARWYVDTPQDQRLRDAIAHRLRDMAGEAGKDSPRAESTQADDFFQPGHTYTTGPRVFHCITTTPHPRTGEIRAFGWYAKSAGGWQSAEALDPDDFTHMSWTEVTEGGAADA